jgi:(1->4)-alpha-D-glucan 1-alpha-D-glucosylmutase
MSDGIAAPRSATTATVAPRTATTARATQQAQLTMPVRATVRLQFHAGFTLDAAVPLVPYFARLGISHIYASPLLKARAGSTHGYDVVDPTQINPELGGEAALRRLVATLRQHGMGLILDIVSNHMAVGGADNPWWLDVLEWGPASSYARFFDIQWQSQDPLMNAQLLVPFLRSDYGEVLTSGEITLHFDAGNGQLHAQHFDHRFPLAPQSYADVLGPSEHAGLRALARRFAALGNGREDWHAARALRAELCNDSAMCAAAVRAVSEFASGGAERLHPLLERQHYRLASWRTAADDINWRRFFDINELGGLRVENPEVFEALHEKVFALIAEGLIDGLRIDHIDGLANPRAYCRKLRRRVERLLAQRPAELAGRHFPIYVEKILGHGEQLPGDWGVDGSTGYDFMNQVSLLQHDAQGEAPLRELWNRISGRSADFLDEVREARQLVLSSSLAGDVENVAQGLLLIARNDLVTRDFTLGAIRRALLALIINFPVYRTYAGPCGRRLADADIFRQALEGARSMLDEGDWPVLQYLDRWLGGAPFHSLPPGQVRHLRRKVLARFQQLTAPAAAKAVEDTACYRAGVLQSRYDVGFDPQRFSAPATEFHASNLQRAAQFPHALLASATHDHKRGEDMRARLAAISERSSWFAYYLQHWCHVAAPLRQPLEDGWAPAPGDEALIYQTMLGAWPPGLQVSDSAGLQVLEQRLQQWLRKMLREAKLRSSWSSPNVAYEDACGEFIRNVLLSPQGLELRSEIAEAVEAIAPAGALNALAQCLLRMTSPGVPDLYQGCEFWDFSLVDPDNRRAVDYATRAAALACGQPVTELLQHWHNGHIKQWLVAHVLALRAGQPDLFAAGEYQPLQAAGDYAAQVLAFTRKLHDRYLVVVVPVLAASLVGDGPLPHITPHCWRNTRLLLPPQLAGVALRDLCGTTFQPTADGAQAQLPLQQVLATLPVNLLYADFTEQRHERH